MKKFFSLLTLALLTMSAGAATVVEFDLTTGYGNGDEVTTISDSDGKVTLTFGQGTNNNAPKWYTTGAAVRMYGGNTLNIASSGDNITEVVFTFSGTGNTMNNNGASSVNAGTYLEDGATGTWTGNAQNFTITRGGTSGHARIQNIKVTMGGQVVTIVADPEFSPADGTTFTDTQAISLTCATAGATISYSIDNKANWLTYSDPFTINATTTVYAKAALNGTESNEVSATYTKVDAPVGGDEVTVDFTEQNYTNQQDFDGQTVTINGISIAFSKGEGSTTPKYYTSDTSMRLYANNTMTVTAPAGKVITGIAFTYASGEWDTTSPNVGTYSTTDAAWIGNAASIVFTNKKSSQVRIKKMVVTLADASTTVAAPVFNPASGTKFYGSLTVTMTSATEGANIVYAVNNGTQVTAASPATVTLTEKSTIVAHAEKDGAESDPVEATYTLKTGVESLEIAADMGADIEIAFTGNAVVTYQNGQYLYIKDETGYGLIFGSTNGGANPVFDQGTMLAPGWQAKTAIYNGLHEFINATGLDSIGITTVAPEIITVDQIEDKVNAYVQIEHVKSVSGTTATLTNGTTVALYKRFGIDIPEFDNANATITGIASVYNGNYQINFIAAEGIVAAPVITPASCNFDESVEVTITAEEGAAIKYSTDETVWNDYSEPLNVTETTTVYAKAVKDGKESIVVSATYTKMEPVTYTLVTDVAELAAGDKIIFVGYHMLEDSVTVQPYAMANFKTNNFAAVAVEQVDNTITTVKANVFTLNANVGNWNFRQDSDGRYLHAAGTDSQNYLKLDTVAHDATITITDEIPVIEFVGENATRFMRFNDNAADNILFSCYKESSPIKNPVYIFKAQPAAPAYQRGDVNMDGEIDINDVTRLIDVVLGKDVAYDATAADCNTAAGDGGIDINDVTALINRVLTGNW